MSGRNIKRTRVARRRWQEEREERGFEWLEKVARDGGHSLSVGKKFKVIGKTGSLGGTFICKEIVRQPDGEVAVTGYGGYESGGHAWRTFRLNRVASVYQEDKRVKAKRLEEDAA